MIMQIVGMATMDSDEANENPVRLSSTLNAKILKW